MPATLIGTPQSIAGGCQNSEMAALLKSLSLAFTNSFLPKYRVKYYDYIIKWCSGIQCDWCVSMDIDYIFALTSSCSEGISVIS